jgi:hypothetical protein
MGISRTAAAGYNRIDSVHSDHERRQGDSEIEKIPQMVVGIKPA